MSSNDDRSGAPSGDAPSMLDLVQLSPRPLFPPGGKDLYRQIAILSDLKAGDEILVVACGTGVTLEYFVREFGAHGSGAEPDRALAAAAEARARQGDLQGAFQVQQAPVDDLPFRDGIFDVVLAEVGFASSGEPRDAVRELVRVAKPGARIALVQLVWKAAVEPERQEALSRHLGVQPLMLVELKRMLREAGLENLHVESWTDEETAFRPALKKPFPDFAELFSLPEKIGILRRAWLRWGWRGVQTAVQRELAVHRLLTRERILGLDLIMGRKRSDAPEDDVPEASEGTESPPRDLKEEGGEEPGGPPPAGKDATDRDREMEEATEGLPLFGSRRGP